MHHRRWISPSLGSQINW